MSMMKMKKKSIFKKELKKTLIGLIIKIGGLGKYNC